MSVNEVACLKVKSAQRTAFVEEAHTFAKRQHRTTAELISTLQAGPTAAD